jgi:hypothetical protein
MQPLAKLPRGRSQTTGMVARPTRTKLGFRAVMARVVVARHERNEVAPEILLQSMRTPPSPWVKLSRLIQVDGRAWTNQINGPRPEYSLHLIL